MNKLARILLGVLVLTLGCRSTTTRPRVDDGQEGSGAALPSPGEDNVVDPAVLDGADPPTVVPEEQSCRIDDDCRAYQPGDWSPRVECCYEYPCDLDYTAVNQRTWTAMRAWRDANPFDCAAHLQDVGPCRHRTARCGLDQQAPPAACVDGLCIVAWPDPWPAVDPEAQACTVDPDCLAYRPSSSSTRGRCCGDVCGSQWVAISRATAVEIDRWTHERAEPCATWLAANSCPEPLACSSTPPRVECRGGACVVP